MPIQERKFSLDSIITPYPVSGVKELIRILPSLLSSAANSCIVTGTSCPQEGTESKISTGIGSATATGTPKSTKTPTTEDATTTTIPTNASTRQ